MCSARKQWRDTPLLKPDRLSKETKTVPRWCRRRLALVMEGLYLLSHYSLLALMNSLARPSTIAGTLGAQDRWGWGRLISESNQPSPLAPVPWPSLRRFWVPELSARSD